jgi:hypothetical protein
MDAPSLTRGADLVVLRARLEDLSRRRIAALEQPPAALSPAERLQLRAMRFDLAELEYHLARLEAN